MVGIQTPYTFSGSFNKLPGHIPECISVQSAVVGCFLQKMFSLQITPSTAQPASTVGGTIRRLLQRLVADPAPLERTISGTLAQRSLVAAIRTGLLDALLDHPGQDSRKLAENCNCSLEGVDILVHALAGTGLLSRCGSGWKVKRAYTQLLKKDSFLRYWLDYTDSVISPALLSLEDSVRSGKPEGLMSRVNQVDGWRQSG